MQVEKPRGPKDQWCPFWRKRQYEVCHTCPMWVHLTGADAQNPLKEVDIWECTLAIAPQLILEGTRVQRETGAAVESFRNVMAKGLARSYANTRLGRLQNEVRLIGDAA